MKTYPALKASHRRELSAFAGIFFAFSKQQFNEGLKKVDLDPTETKDKLVSLGAGGFLRRSRFDDFQALLAKHEAEMDVLKANPEALRAALIYELRNREYCITRDPSSALRALGLTEDEIPPEMMREACQHASSQNL